MKTKQKTFKFKKGQKCDLDYIYDIQGLGDGDWWKPDSDDDDITDDVVITKDITIKIVVTKSS